MNIESTISPELLRQLDIHFRQPDENLPDPNRRTPPASVNDPAAPWHVVRLGAHGVTWLDSIRGYDRDDAIRNARWNWFAAAEYPADWFEYLALDDDQD